MLSYESDSAAQQRSTRYTQTFGALILARAGENGRALVMAEELAHRFPSDTLLHTYWLPTIRATTELNRKNPRKAIEYLQAASSSELGLSPPAAEVNGLFLPVYLRGEAYLLLRQGKEAAAEFQKFFDYRGITSNCPLAALAHVQLARAYEMQGDSAKARAAYQDFLMLWKDADPNVPILKQAKAEYAKLQ